MYVFAYFFARCEMSVRLGFHVFNLANVSPDDANTASMESALCRLHAASAVSTAGHTSDTAWLSRPVDPDAACFVPPFLPQPHAITTTGLHGQGIAAGSSAAASSSPRGLKRARDHSEPEQVSLAWRMLPTASRGHTDWNQLFIACSTSALSMAETVALFTAVLLGGQWREADEDTSVLLPTCEQLNMPSSGELHGAATSCCLALLLSCGLLQAASAQQAAGGDSSREAKGLLVHGVSVPLPTADSASNIIAPCSWTALAASIALRSAGDVQPGAVPELQAILFAAFKCTRGSGSHQAWRDLVHLLHVMQSHPAESAGGAAGGLQGRDLQGQAAASVWRAIRLATAALCSCGETLQRSARGVVELTAIAVDMARVSDSRGGEQGALQALVTSQPRLLRALPPAEQDTAGETDDMLAQQHLIVLRLLRKALALVELGPCQPPPAVWMAVLRPVLPLLAAFTVQPASHDDTSLVRFKADVASAAAALLEASTAQACAPLCALARACARLAQK